MKRFTWNNGTQNKNHPKVKLDNPYTYSLNNMYNSSLYTCNQCTYVPINHIISDPKKDTYCIKIDAHHLSCYPVQLDSHYDLHHICSNCPLKTIKLNKHSNIITNTNTLNKSYHQSFDIDAYSRHIPYESFE